MALRVMLVLLHIVPLVAPRGDSLYHKARRGQHLVQRVYQGVTTAPPSSSEVKSRFRTFLDALSSGIAEAENAIRQREDALVELLEGRAKEDPSDTDPDQSDASEGNSDVGQAGEAPSEDELEEDDRKKRREEKEEEKREEEERRKKREDRDDDDKRDNRRRKKRRGGRRKDRDEEEREETRVEADGPSKEELAAHAGEHMPVNEKWFTLWYWAPLVSSISFMTVMIDVVAPLYDTFAEFSLLSEVFLMSVAVFGFAIIIFSTMAPGAAGVPILLANATLSSTLTLLTLLLALSLYARKVSITDPAMQLSQDVAKLYRPVLRVMMVCIILQVITYEAKVDWSQLAMIMAFLMLGIALSLTGVISDIMAHIFIRLDNHFVEGDYIVWQNDLVQIERLEWRHTIGVLDSSNAYIYIPNSQLTSDSVINQCEDNERRTEIDIAVEAEADDLEQCVRNVWEVFAEMYKEDFTFEGSDGSEYKNQFDIDQCGVWLKEDGMSIHITIYGKYFFSEPPAWDDPELPEPPMEERHFDWERGWYMQVEWFNLEVKSRNEALLKSKDTNWPAQDPR